MDCNTIEEVIYHMYDEYKKLNGFDHCFYGQLEGYVDKKTELEILIEDMEFFNKEENKYIYEEPLNEELLSLIDKGKELLK